MKQITFFVEGDPKAQPRPRATVGKTRAHVYNPRTNLEWRARVRVEAKRCVDNERPKKGEAVSVRFTFYLRRPKSHYDADGSVKDGEGAPAYHTCKPDVDNLAKPVLDEIKNVGLLHDDAQVVKLTVVKKWSKLPGLNVTIEWS